MMEINVLLPIQNDTTPKMNVKADTVDDLRRSFFPSLFSYKNILYHIKSDSSNDDVADDSIPCAFVIQKSESLKWFLQQQQQQQRKKSHFYCIALKYGAIPSVIINALYWCAAGPRCAWMNFNVKSNAQGYAKVTEQKFNESTSKK